MLQVDAAEADLLGLWWQREQLAHRIEHHAVVDEGGDVRCVEDPHLRRGCGR